MHPAHEARVQVAGRVGLHQALEVVIHCLRWRWAAGQWLPQFLAQRFWHRLPDGAVPKGRKMIEHIIDHAVSEGAQICPVIGIKALVGRDIVRTFLLRHYIPVVIPSASITVWSRTGRGAGGRDTAKPMTSS